MSRCLLGLHLILSAVASGDYSGEEASTFSFITIGDWGSVALGSYHATAAKAVAKQMGATAASAKAQFIVNTGDNFYYCGIQNSSDNQVQTDFQDVYTDRSLQVTWYSTLGNHEYGYNVDAQLKLTDVDPSKRWYLPDRYFTYRKALSSRAHATFIHLDTNPCVKAYRSASPSGWDPCSTEFPSCAPIEEGECKFHENILSQDCSTQFQWFKEELKKVPDDDWLIIVGHHPADEMDVEDFVTPIQESGAHLYLNGHVHDLEYYTLDGKGAYVTSGAGGMVRTHDQDNDPRCSDERLEGKEAAQSRHKYKAIFEKKVAGFTLHTFSNSYEKLTTEFISYTGEVLYKFDLDKSARAPPSVVI